MGAYLSQRAKYFMFHCCCSTKLCCTRKMKTVTGCISLKPSDEAMVGQQLGATQHGHAPEVQFSSQHIDLHALVGRTAELFAADQGEDQKGIELTCPVNQLAGRPQIGRASCRERVCQYV